MSFTPEERTFTLLNGLVIAARHWKNTTTRHPRDGRRILAMHGLLDNAASFDLVGPYTLPIEEQPQRLLKFLAAKKTLSTKRDAFFPTIQAAVRARTLGSKDSVWPIREDVAAVFIPRSLKPTEQKDEHTQTTQQGYSWCWDRMIMISDVMANSDLYTKAFVSRVTCPVLFILAIDGYAWKREKDGKVMSWFTASSSVTVRDVEGGHHVHIEDAPTTARLITEWLLEQESSMKARL
ncbi:hypothetical protein DFQ27_001016 [Actinomortierella ambigua]|uniref:Alpha/beta hydrolase n=1 Tax=Actinomortierella ambigua TaxID=1343610 RepID=A0A9P6U876_9FUNG|nr:hypothetical protein DFQ27_001016 [Actinomortierella ambigua]